MKLYKRKSYAFTRDFAVYKVEIIIAKSMDKSIRLNRKMTTTYIQSAYTASPRRKQIPDGSNELYHCTSNQEKDTIEITSKLSSDPISYVHWFDDIVTGIVGTNFEQYLVGELVPINGQYSEYITKINLANELCKQNEMANLYLNLIICESLDEETKSLMQTECLASENFEMIKSSFVPRLNAFYLLDLESKFDFDPNNVLVFLHNLDSLTKLYYHIFRESADSDLKIQWIMNALNKNYLLNKPIIDQIQIDWGKISKDPFYIRTILTNFLFIYKHKRVRNT